MTIFLLTKILFFLCSIDNHMMIHNFLVIYSHKILFFYLYAQHQQKERTGEHRKKREKQKSTEREKKKEPNIYSYICLLILCKHNDVNVNKKNIYVCIMFINKKKRLGRARYNFKRI